MLITHHITYRITYFKHIVGFNLQRPGLTNCEAKMNTFYGLPKIHKSLTIIKAIKEDNTEYVNIYKIEYLQFHTIIACPTHRGLAS